MATSNKEKQAALVRIAIAYFIWQTLDQWGRLIQPFMMWELKPAPDTFQIGLINTLGNAFVMIGTVITGYLLDSVGTKPTAALVCVVSGAYAILSSQIRNVAFFCICQSLRIFFAFPQITEAFVGSLYGEFDGRGRMRALIWLGIPQGLAMVLGPWLAGQSFTLTEYNLQLSYAISGIILVISLLPTILFVIPEPRSVTSSFGSQNLPLTTVYSNLLRNPQLLKTLLFRLTVEGPFIAYDQMSRYYFVSFLIQTPSDMSYMAIMIGLSTLATNMFLMKPLQKRLSGQRMLQLALVLLTIAYMILANVDNYWKLMLVLPIQVIGVSMAFAVLSAQMIGCVDSANVGKAAGLGQSVSQLCAAVVPLITGYLMLTYEFSIICYASAVISVIGFVMVHLLGNFMTYSVDLLPTTGQVGDYDKGA